ncbi:hypothetical protein P8C59_004840 [Phyllachora maydis]|uniref:AB hydrolase-1 domain-containing protein n=1 Tax=Phyllachora maydis TaxID=1825666 RepID=A0AAD9I361_9PEZI|nr:hypothetical protein P8C59_004840 [Phyllachora maydis]
MPPRTKTWARRGKGVATIGLRDIDQEEKKRGRRLFGGLLHTLSQPASNSGQQKRRQDAERRQLEKAQNQRVEDDKRRLERLSNILHIRETEQVKFHDEVIQRQNVKARTLARFLCTKADPSLYYVPWKLTPSQEATLDRQEQDAEDLSMRSTQTISRPKETSPGNVGQLSEPKSLRDTNKDKEAPLKTSHEKEHDEGGDEMVQDNEDSYFVLRHRNVTEMAPDKLAPNDSRVEHHTAVVRSKTYHYVLATPAGAPPSATVLLIHGFPDIGFGWRYQVPELLSLNLRVIVPDMLGYGRTDAPEPLAAYSLKSVAADMAALAALVVGAGQQVILGGHDWGGFLIWRIALWHPELVRAVFSVCTPYTPPPQGWVPDDQFVKMLPNFRYQLQFAGPDVEAHIVGKEKLRQLLNGLYGGKGPNGEVGFSTEKGVLLENLGKLGPTALLSSEELDFYVEEFNRHGLRGPLNWYRTRAINYEEERALEVDAPHWALWEKPEVVNGYIREFVTSVLENGGTKSSL